MRGQSPAYLDRPAGRVCGGGRRRRRAGQCYVSGEILRRSQGRRTLRALALSANRDGRWVYVSSRPIAAHQGHQGNGSSGMTPGRNAPCSCGSGRKYKLLRLLSVPSIVDRRSSGGL
ncbi:MAG TPA: hypothetical protein ENJ18_19545 [Nannocystis exedens]|nr:hypothetical protein [Nannocystis exedens]